MSVRGKWRVVETPEYDMAVSGSYILFAEDGGEFALDCSQDQSMAAAKAMPSRSHGTAAMRWSPPAAMVGRRHWTTALSKVRSASNVVTIFPLSPADRRLLQRPVRALSITLGV